MLQKINSQMSLGGRLSIISGVFAASSVFATGLFVRSEWSQIQFTDVERSGAASLPDVWRAIGDGTALKSPDELRANFKADATVDAFSRAQGPAERLAAGRALIAKIADGSNLTLDPDLDSFYVMDAVTVRLPKLKQAIFDLENALAETGGGSATDVAVAFDRLNFATSEAYGSLSLGIENNKGGKTKAAIGADAEALQQKAQTTITAAKAVTAGGGDSKALVSSLKELSMQVDATWSAGAGELSRLLEARDQKLNNELALELGFIVLSLAAAGLLSWSVASALSQRLRALLDTMDALTAGKKDVEIPCLSDVNETGKIGRTLEQFKRSLLENEEAERRSAEEKIRADAERRKSEEEAQARAQELVVSAFGEGMDALANGVFSYRINRDLPEAYRKLRDDFHLALQKLEAATRATEEAARQRVEDQRAAEAARKQAEAEAMAAAERLVVGSFGEGMTALAGGDLTYRITREVPDAYVQLRDDFNAAVASMQQAISAIANNAVAVRGGAGEVAQATEDLSRRTEQQAASLEETAAALDQVGGFQPIERAAERDRLDLENFGERALLDALVAREIGERLPLRARQPEMAGPLFEALAQEARGVVEDEAEGLLVGPGGHGGGPEDRCAGIP